MDLPNEIMFKILSLLPDNYKLRIVNKQFKYIIENIASYYNNKFNNITKNWKKNIKKLIPHLIEKNDIDSIIYLSTNFTLNKTEQYEINFYAGFYNNTELINSNLTNSYQTILNGAAYAGNLDLIEKYKDRIYSLECLESYAAKGGKKNILKYINKQDIINSNIIICSAAEGGHLDIILEYMNYVDNANILLYDMIALSAAKYGHLHIIKWAYEKGATDNVMFEITILAAENGFLDIILWGVDNGIHIFNRIASISSSNGHLNIIKWLIDDIHYDDYDNIAFNAAEYGHLDIIKYVMKYNKNIINLVANIAASNGYFDVLQYALENNADDFIGISMGLVINGEIYIIDYIFKLIPSIIKNIALFAASLGKLNLVKYAIDNGAVNIFEIARESAKSGYLNVFKHLIKKKSDDLEKLKDCAKLYCNYNIVEYIDSLSA